MLKQRIFTMNNFDKFFDFTWKNTKFRQRFNRALMIAFLAWEYEDPEIKKAMQGNDFAYLNSAISKLIAPIANYEKTFAPHGLNMVMPGVNLLIQKHDTPFTRYEKNDVRNASPDYSFTQFLSDLNLTENLFLVGQILLNVSKLQNLYEILDNSTLTREQIAELSNRSAIISDAQSRLEFKLNNKIKGGIGGKNKGGNKKQNVQKLILKANLRRPTNKQTPDFIRNLKTLYKPEYGKDLQTLTSKGRPTPTDSTLERWIQSAKFPKIAS